MTGARASIVGLGCAAPLVSLAQERTLEIALRLSPVSDAEERRRIEAIYRRSGIERRGVATESEEAPGDPVELVQGPGHDPRTGPGTAERVAWHTRRVAPLAHRACAAALADAATSAGSITHLVTASCTGFAAPGWDVQLVERLGMSAGVLRTHVGFMGCHAAINALRVAAAFVGADPSARVLVCCAEVCSVHFRRGARLDQVVANALFADGAAACVVAQSSRGLGVVRSTSSRVLPESADQMGWGIGDHGFEMSLGAGLPESVRRHAGAWVREWLGGADGGLGGVRSWAVHPGGPRILDAFEEGVGLEHGTLRASREVLAAHGNMSSPTVLFILDHMRRHGTLSHPCAVVSFGPGVAAEGLLLVH